MVLKRLIQHSYIRSFNDVITKLLLTESFEYELKGFIDIENLQKDLLLDLFSKLDLNSDNESILNVASLCAELCEHKAILELIIGSSEILNVLIGLLSKDISLFNNNAEHNYSEILLILINILKLIQINNLKMPFCDISSILNVSLEKTELGELLLKNLNLILANFCTENESLLDGTFGKTYNPLGIRR
jgi:hypothetical protein